MPTEPQDGWANLARVGGHLAKQAPDFDARNYGFPRLSELVAASGLVDMEIESIRVMLPGLPGDLTGDGRVDGADILLWQRNGGTAAELATIKANFGTTGSTGFVAAVPEPASLSVAVLATVVVAGARRVRVA